MKNKNIILFAIATFLGILGILLNDPFGFFRRTYMTSEPLLKNFDSEEVRQVSVINPSEATLIFFKKDKEWFVKEKNEPETEYRTEDGLIDSALRILTTITRYLMVSENEARFPEMRLTRQHRYIIIQRGAKPDITLFIGAPGGRSGTNLVRLGSENKVYLAKGRIRSYWDKSRDYYRSKKLFHNIPQKIASIHVQLWSKDWGNRDYKIFLKKAKGWFFTEKNNIKPLEAFVVKKFSQRLLFSEGKHFYYSKKGLPRFARVKFVFGNKIEKTLNILGPDIGYQFIAHFDRNLGKMTLEHQLTDSLIYFPALSKSEAASMKNSQSDF